MMEWINRKPIATNFEIVEIKNNGKKEYKYKEADEMSIKIEYRECRRCGLRKPISELNIEGLVHHRTPIHCLDQKKCNRQKRKTGREKKR